MSAVSLLPAFLYVSSRDECLRVGLLPHVECSHVNGPIVSSLKKLKSLVMYCMEDGTMPLGFSSVSWLVKKGGWTKTESLTDGCTERDAIP